MACQTTPRNTEPPTPAGELSLDDRLAKIDREHAMLLSMQDLLLTALNQHFRRKTVAKMLHILKLYTRFHFELEESTMVLCRYDRLREHQCEHQAFWSDLDRIVMTFDQGGDVYDDVRKLFVRLAHHHIRNSDEAFIQFARQSVH